MSTDNHTGPSERWTCSDTGRAIKARGIRLRELGLLPPAEPVRTGPDHMVTLLLLLTGTGPPIPDSDVRSLEAWLDGGGPPA